MTIIIPASEFGVSQCCTRKLVMSFDASIVHKRCQPRHFPTQLGSFNSLVLSLARYPSKSLHSLLWPHTRTMPLQFQSSQKWYLRPGLCPHLLTQLSPRVFSAHPSQACHFPRVPQKLTSSHQHHCPTSLTNSWLHLHPQAFSDTI
jgi:hypothetical protein